MTSFVNPNINDLVKKLNNAMKQVSKANCGLLHNPTEPPAQAEIFDSALDALAKVEDELRLIRAYIESSKRRHEKQGEQQ